MAYRELVAKSEVALSIALGDLDSVVDVFNVHCVVGDVLDHARATATLEIFRQSRRNTRPHFNTSTVLFYINIANPSLNKGVLTDALNMEIL